MMPLASVVSYVLVYAEHAVFFAVCLTLAALLIRGSNK